MKKYKNSSMFRQFFVVLKKSFISKYNYSLNFLNHKKLSRIIIIKQNHSIKLILFKIDTLQ